MIKREFKDKPRICLIDADDYVAELLETAGFNYTRGTLGTLVALTTTGKENPYRCIPDCDFPNNLHEFDILVVDMKERAPVPYDHVQHQRSVVKGTSDTVVVSRYPQTLFDPRPLCSTILGAELHRFNRETIIVVFAGAKEELTYEFLEQHSSGGIHRTFQELDNYSFLRSVPKSTNRVGRDTRVAPFRNDDLVRILRNHNDSFSYQIAFGHRQQRKAGTNTWEDSPDFIPLILNSLDEIVAYAEWIDENLLLLFPQLETEEKAEFLLELLDESLPSVAPKFFPHSTRFAWLQDSAYVLPNEAELKAKKARTRDEYEARLAEIDAEIERNYQHYHFLHDLLTQTGSELVKTVAGYLEWLGFEEVVNVDEVREGPNEEDLQVKFANGLLVVEVKGIAGTSTDAQCSQVNKFRIRRMRDHRELEVYALYIVNHQRFLPPETRANPPFTAHQIRDAEEDERGLLTTYQLFNLYFAIEQGSITKEDARRALLKYGPATFAPSQAVSIGTAKELYYGGEVGIFDIEMTNLSLGEEVVVEDDGRFRKARILGLQVNGKDMDRVAIGEIGVKFSVPLKKTTIVWIPNARASETG